MSEIREPREHRLCAFCDAPWSEAMIAAFGPERPCACCDSRIAGHWPIVQEPAAPTRDIVCHACGRTLYLAPGNVISRAAP